MVNLWLNAIVAGLSAIVFILIKGMCRFFRISSTNFTHKIYLFYLAPQILER